MPALLEAPHSSTASHNYNCLPVDPYQLKELLWPHITLYDKQWEVVYSFDRNDETYVKAGNMLGKDFLTAFCCIMMMLKYKECRGITTSVKDDHLRVLWDEINWWLLEASYPADREDKNVLSTLKGGPMRVNHRDIRMSPDHGYSNKSYLRGMVSETGEGMSGHHARDMTFLVSDEASAANDLIYTYGQGWSKKFLLIGNPNECQNFYRKGCDAGDLPTPDGKRFYRKVLKISADDSPNVKYAKKELALGKTPTNKVLVPGVIKWDDGIKGYLYRRAHWDKKRQTVGLDGEFYVGPDLKLVYETWIEEAIAYAKIRPVNFGTRYLGIDPAEGGDDTAWVVIDRAGVLYIESIPTSDTNVIFGRTLDIMKKWNVEPENTLFDRACGKAHADRLRAMGMNVRTVDFGTIKADPKRGIRIFPEKREMVEEKGGFVNRRSEMYWNFRALLEIPLQDSDDPLVKQAIDNLPSQIKTTHRQKFAFPLPLCEELIRELRPIPLKYDELGRFKLLPKTNPDDPDDQETLQYLIGRSPDQADACALAVYGMLNKPIRSRAGAN